MALDDDLKAVLAQVGKGTGEVLEKLGQLDQQISDLTEMVGENADAKAQLEAAAVTVGELKVAAQKLDDIVPDVEEPPVEPEEPPVEG